MYKFKYYRTTFSMHSFMTLDYATRNMSVSRDKEQDNNG